MRFVFGLLFTALLHVVAAGLVAGWDDVLELLIAAGMSGMIPGGIIGQVAHLSRIAWRRVTLACSAQVACVGLATAMASASANVLVLFMGYLAGQLGGVILALYLMTRPRQRPDPNCCAKCGYSLIGLPEPRCPECGTPFDPAAVTGNPQKQA